MRYKNTPKTSLKGLNAELVKVEEAFLDVLDRQGDGTNFMDDDLDMNSHRILNLPEPMHSQEPVRLGDVKPFIDETQAARDAAVEAAEEAQASKEAAQSSETAAQASALSAEESATEAKEVPEVRTIARSLGVTDEEVIYSTDTTTLLDDVIYIYDSSLQIIYGKPSAVNAGEYIVSVVGSTLTSSAGTYQLTTLDNGKVIDVSKYGAFNGVDLDDAALYKAIADLSEGDTLYFPSVEVNISSTLIISKDRIKIETSGATITSTNNIAIFTITGDYVTVEGFNFNPYNDDSLTSYTILVTGDHSKILRNTFDYRGGRGKGLHLLSASYSEVSGNSFINSKSTVDVFTSVTGSDIFIGNSSSYNTIEDNFLISGNSYAVNNTITGNGESFGNTIRDNVVDNYTAYGIIVYKSEVGETETIKHRRHMITGNRISNISGAALQDVVGNYYYGAGIYIQRAMDCIVTGNTLENTASYTNQSTLPIGAIGGTQHEITIANNRILGANRCGIYLSSLSGAVLPYGDDTIANAVITGNVIEITGTNSQDAGIKSVNGIKTSIRDNMIRATNSKGAGINLSSQNSPLRNVDAIITGNSIYDTEYGILTADSETVTISKNVIKNVSSTGLQCNDAPVSIVSENILDGANIGIYPAPDTLLSNNVVLNASIPYHVNPLVAIVGDVSTFSAYGRSAFRLTGTTAISSITGGVGGETIVLKAESNVTITKGSLVLNATYAMTSGDTLTLWYSGVQWFEVARSTT